MKTVEAFPGIFENETAKLPLSTPSQVAFAVDLFVESVAKTHETDLSIFTARWDVLSAGLPAEKRRAPLDIKRFIVSVHEAMLRSSMPTQAIMLSLISLEREILHGLSLVLFENNAVLLDAMPRRQGDTSVGQESSTNDAALFNALCDVISFWDPSDDSGLVEAGTSNSPVATKPIPQEDMAMMLTELQKWVPKVLEDALGQEPGKLGESIKQVIIRRAEAFGAPKGATVLAADDEHAVNLVDGAFSQNLMQRKMQSAARSIMAQMLFPSVKAAILDRQWFSKNEHPARKLLESITTACTSKDGSEPPVDVMKKASETVDKLVAGFNEDVSMFEELAKDLQDYMNNRVTKHTAVRNSESGSILEYINKCREELIVRWNNKNTAQRVKHFSITVGSQYLAGLDQGGLRGTGQWVAALTAFDQLIDMKSSAAKPAPIDGGLRASLISILSKQGLVGVRAHHALAELEDSIHQYRVLGLDPPPIQNILPEMVFAPMDSGNTVDTEKNSREASGVSSGSVSGAAPAETKLVAPAIDKNDLMVGTLWKLVDRHGDTVLVKLTWVSPITSKHLFTNQKGGRELVAGVTEIEELVLSGALKKQP